MAHDEGYHPRLVVTEPSELAGTVLTFDQSQLVIGHSDTADLVLADRFVSRRHALVTVDSAGQVSIRDLNSLGGTFVNDERLAGPRVLQPGDIVRFADLAARFEPADAPEAAVTRAMPVVSADRGTAPPDGASAVAPGSTYTVTGTVLSPAVGAIAGLTVQLVDKNVGGDRSITSTQTARDGSYSFTHFIADAYLAARHKTSPDFQVQVLAGGAVVAMSDVAYSASSSTSLDVVLPAVAPGLPSEYETLTASMAAVYPGSLGTLQENATQQDITYLAGKTELDARVVALMALASQFGQLTPPPPAAADTGAAATAPLPVQGHGIAPEFYYALFRAGLPASTDSLFQASPATVQAIWEQAVTGGVIPQRLAKQVPAAVVSFQAIGAARSLDAPPPAGISTLREMITATLPETAQQDQFARLYAQYQGNWAAFWEAAETAFGTTASNALRLTGQLLYLTVNNQPLVAALQAAEKGSTLTSPLDLVSRGYYDPAPWTPLIGAAIPSQIPGATADEQTANYAQLLAAQVRIAYPTAVAGDQVRRNILPMPGAADVAQSVAGFLAEHQADFAIGVEPVQAYLARTGLTTTAAPVVSAIKRIQRVYQLTPDDVSMSTLLYHNLDSAFAITRYDAAGFARAFTDHLGGGQAGADKAAAIHARARQVFAATLSVTVGYLGARLAPGLGGVTPIQYGFAPPAEPPDFPVTAYPTLEDLFGSLDYCDCTDCGSILSPAAYLVDLLNYLDQPSPAGGGANPLDLLLARRPDLQYLPLTCANTNTALPYIDVVNELLEYFVANGLRIAGYQGHDTGDIVTAAELEASPQYVNNAAYGLLQTAFFPPPLPFSRPLELLRFHLASLGVGLPAAMTALRASDALTDTSTPTSYGWTDILLEQLTISRDELKLFTDPALQLSDLYGLPSAGTALATLQTTSLQEFSRRLGVSYDDLVAITQTRFINPNAALIPRLEQLDVPFATLQALQQNLNTPQSIAADFIAGLPSGLDATQYGGTSPTDYQAVVNWVTSPQNYQRIMSIIVISDPEGTADDCSGAALQFRYANPDNSANLLSGTDFIKLIRFIRLWRKLAPLLGDQADAATIEQTDDILGALYPAADIPANPADQANDAANRTLLDAGFATALPRLGAAFQVLDALSLTADEGLDQVLACWAPIGTTGTNSLYARMFLSPALLQQDPGAQTATVAPTVNAGDQLTTSINGAVDIPVYTVPAGQSAAQVATAVAGSVNGSATPDPVSGQPIGSRFHASTDGADGVITLMAGFTLECTVSAGATETYTAAAGTPITRTAAVGGSVRVGDALTTVIDTVPVTYQVAAGDTTATIAAGIAAAVNAATMPDPYSGLPLNSLVVAYAATGSSVVSLTTADAGAPFALSCSLKPAGAGTYTAATPSPASCTATIGGTLATGDVLVTTVNSVAVSYTAASADPATVAAGVAAAINAAVTSDPVSQLPLNEEVQAASSGDVITVTAIDPATPVTLSCSASGGPVTYTAAGPLPEMATATVAGVIPAGTILTTTVNSLPLVSMAAPGDTPASIATAIAGLVNGCATADPVTSLPLNTVVTATAAGGVVTFTGTSPTTPFTLAVAISAAGYTAGQATPPFADDGYGDFLADPAQTLFGHEPTLCAACNITSAEFALIASALGFDASTPLSLANVSALFRYGWLARALGLSVLEFLLLRQWSGLNPFAPLDPSPTAPAQPAALRFIGLLTLLRAAGLTTNQALYLMWNSDVSGTSMPPLTTVTGLALTLAADFAAVEAQFALQVDPDGSIARNLMTLVYGATASAFFFGLLNGTFTTSVGYSTPAGVSALPAQVITASTGRLSYDDLAKQLTFAGVLDAATVTAIDSAVTAYAPDAATLSAAVGSLATACQQVTAPFFATYPELLPLYTAYVASSAAAQDKRTALLASFLPVLKDKRKQEQALAAITAAAGTDPSFAAALLADPTILHADDEVTLPAVSDLMAIENQGLSASFYLGNNPAAAPDQVIDAVPSLSYGATGAQLPAGTGGGLIAATWRGYLTVPQDGYYDVSVSADAGAVVALSLGGVPVPLTGPSAAGLWSNQGTISLTAGALVPITLTASSIKTTFSVTWQSQGTGWQPISARYLYPLNLVTRLGDTYVRFLKATSLATDLSLTATELAYLGTATSFTVNTTCATNIAVGSAVFTPASMTNIAAGSVLVIDDGSAQEAVTVTAVTATTFTATATKAHDGTTTPFPVVSASFPAIGEGWLNCLTATGWLTGSAGQDGPDPATAASLTGVLTATADFAVMKQALSPSDSRLLAVLQNPSAQLPVSPAAAQLPTTALPAANSALLSLTGWSLASVNALLTRFFGSANPASLMSVINLRRVYDAYAIVTSTGLAAPVLLSAITNAPTPTTVSALQSALRAQYAPGDWLTVIRPVNDQARIAQRDALVAYILQQLGDQYAASLLSLPAAAAAGTGATQLTFAAPADVTVGMAVQGASVAPGTSVTAVSATATQTTVTLSSGILASLPSGTPLTFVPADAVMVSTADDLYQYFLIDTQNQPPVLTSRILLALSAVQLFIERVIRNLEAQVSAADIDQSLWAWMKRYRVWQANREVFLWPENWLYPELRDDQSPFFEQMMSSLLQGDITDDAAASGYLSYLTNLEEVAKLEQCGLYYVPGTADADETCYVVARTAGAHRKYYFRELTGGSWTPWTQVQVDCEDMPITPIVWNGRLFLFWLKILKQANPGTKPLASTANTQDLASMQVGDLNTFTGKADDGVNKKSVQAGAVLCWSEYYNGTWQPTKTSDVNLPTQIGVFDLTGSNSVEAWRTLLQIVPAQATETARFGLRQVGVRYNFPMPDGSILLAITQGGEASFKGGFILHNTHSLPIRIDDISVSPLNVIVGHGWFAGVPLVNLLTPPSPSRAFSPAVNPPYTGGYGTGSFSVNYYNGDVTSAATYTETLFAFSWLPRYIDTQPWLASPWDAPFIYEDRRHLFYVVTTESLRRIWKYPGFGIIGASQGMVAVAGRTGASAIPPLLLRQPVVASTPKQVQAITAAAGNPAAIQHYLATGTDLSLALPSNLAISYQGQVISPVGSLADLLPAITDDKEGQ